MAQQPGAVLRAAAEAGHRVRELAEEHKVLRPGEAKREVPSAERQKASGKCALCSPRGWRAGWRRRYGAVRTERKLPPPCLRGVPEGRFAGRVDVARCRRNGLTPADLVPGRRR